MSALHKCKQTSRSFLIHPQLPIEWEAREFFDGTLSFDPTCPEAESTLTYTRLATTATLSRAYQELGYGTRGVVFHGGALVIKRCVSGNQPNITGLEAVTANVALATALDRHKYKVGDYTLKACMPRGVFLPTSIVGHPTWVMDHAKGESAQEMVNVPTEAMYNMRVTRDMICRTALQECGVDPSRVFLDTEEHGNLIIDRDHKVLTVIDSAAPAVSPGL